MSPRRLLASVAAALALLLGLAGQAGAATTITPAPVTAARLTADAAQRAAARYPRASSLRSTHVLARFTATYDGASRTWRVVLQDPQPSFPIATVTVDDRTGRATGITVTGEGSEPARLSMAQAKAYALRSGKASDWLDRYRSHHRAVTDSTTYASGKWLYRAWSDGKQILEVQVDDATGALGYVRIGPQVAWSMARGSRGSFGHKINDYPVFYGFLALFAIGLLPWRRLWSLRTLDVLALASMAVSWELFNRGLVFWCVPLQYPTLLYVVWRLVRIGLGRRGDEGYRPAWPAWFLLGLAIFAMGFRVGLNAWGSNVVDVGYAGVVGADRIADGHSPYGNMPQGPPEETRPCGIRLADGSYSAYVQKNGRCETPVGHGDTYGPAMYLAYVPATAVYRSFGERWSGRWDALPIAHVTSTAFDILAGLGLFVAGWRLGRLRTGTLCLFFWATYPFTAFSLSSNSNDMIVAATIAWALALLPNAFWRGVMVGLGIATKFAPALILPLFLRAGRDRPHRRRDLLRPGPGGVRTALGVLAALVATFGILVVFDGPHGLTVFWDRTFGWQLDRPSPFSVWDWGEYPGFPDLALEQKVLKGVLLLAAAGLYLLPRRLDAGRIAAFTGALMAGFQIVLTHWMYLYCPWWVPGLAVALFAARPALAPAVAPEAVRDEAAEPAEVAEPLWQPPAGPQGPAHPAPA